MRCNNCNVDLGEEYTTCPLCGENAVQDEPLIKNQRTAQYPDVTTKAYHQNPFVVFLFIWAVTAIGSLIYCGAAGKSNYLAGIITIGVACIWSLFFRPVFIKQLYYGNYLVADAAVISVFLIYIEYKSGNVLVPMASSIYIPVLIVAALIAIIIGFIFKPELGRRAAPYTIWFLICGIVGIIYVLASKNEYLYMWLAEIVFTLLTFGLIMIIDGKSAIEEIKAKFSIQQKVKAK